MASTLLDRYLHAVARYLPVRASQDILAEFAANLHAEADDQARQRGRPLTQEEQVAILRRHGHPRVVAARYQPQRSLIGPEIFPIYAYVLEHSLPVVIGIYVLVRVVLLVYGPTAPAAPLAGDIASVL